MYAYNEGKTKRFNSIYQRKIEKEKFGEIFFKMTFIQYWPGKKM